MATKKQYTLSGIDCANCARKIENGIRKLEGVKEVSLNFALSSLSLEVADGAAIKGIETQIQSIMDSIEKGSKLHVPEETDSKEEAEGHDHGEELSKGRIIAYVLGAIFYFVSFFAIKDTTVQLVIFVAVYILFGYKVLLKSLQNILKGRIFDENFLMTIASVGAFVIGEYPEAAAVMMFYQIGELFQDYALDHSRKSIKSLLNIKPDYANLKTPEGFTRVDPKQVGMGDLLVIRPGERVPLDGIIEDGKSSLDTSALTGESLPREVEEGSEVLSGCINQSGVLHVRVTKTFGESTVNRILSLVENAAQKKAVTERFITRFAAWYTPVVVILAVVLAVAPPLLMQQSFKEWIYRALTFLVVSCPCALVISIPLGFFGGIGAASKRGILVKGGNYLEALAKAETIVFDKTGTLTKGAFEVTEVLAAEPFTQEELLSLIAHGEAFSSHPLALSAIKAYGTEPDKSKVADYREYAGLGVSAQVSGRQVLCGNTKLLSQFGVALDGAGQKGTRIHLAVDGRYAGSIKLEDVLKDDAPKAISALAQAGIDNIVLLTGDQKDAAEDVARRLGIEKVHAELLPHEKVQQLENLLGEQNRRGSVVFVGDGINDAPVIARADVGVAMGGAGSDAAIEAADIVVMTDEPYKLAEALRIARKTKTVVYQNIALAIIVKLLVLALGAGGVATLWEAVFADVGVALIAIFNAMRVAKVKKA
jgi:Cd2+/Zn2+-exporting ATPase